MVLMPSVAAGVAAASKAQRRRSSGQGNVYAVSMPTQRFVVDVTVRMDLCRAIDFDGSLAAAVEGMKNAGVTIA
jgi:hypothetical protein